MSGENTKNGHLKLTGEIRSQIDSIWNSFWSGGISNPLEVMEQITFLRRLDELHTPEENKAQRLNKPIARCIFPEGNDNKGRDFNDLRWSRFKNFAPAEMFIRHIENRSALKHRMRNSSEIKGVAPQS